MFIIVHEDNDITMIENITDELKESFKMGIIDIINNETLQILTENFEWINIEKED
jgi:hypothetical protein